MDLKEISSMMVKLNNGILELEREYSVMGLTENVINLKWEINKLENIVNNEIKIKKIELEKSYISNGLTEEVVDLSQELDILIVYMQKYNLKLSKLGVLDFMKFVC